MTNGGGIEKCSRPPSAVPPLAPATAPPPARRQKATIHLTNLQNQWTNQSKSIKQL